MLPETVNSTDCAVGGLLGSPFNIEISNCANFGNIYLTEQSEFVGVIVGTHQLKKQAVSWPIRVTFMLAIQPRPMCLCCSLALLGLKTTLTTQPLVSTLRQSSLLRAGSHGSCS